MIVLPILFNSTFFLVHESGRKHRHRQKRNRRLINSILKPLSVPVKDDHKECMKSHDGHAPPTPAYKRFYLNTFFRATDIKLERRETCLFKGLRRHYGIDENDYHAQFQKGTLEGGGNLGFSGAIFFFTPNGRKYIIKSLPNEFEWKFFYNDLLVKYCEYMVQNRDSLLSRITDALFNFDLRLWNYLRLGTASHFLVMQNLLEGFDEEKGCRQWDLKPKDYLRADLMMAKTEEREKLVLQTDAIELTREAYDKLMENLAKDSEFLAQRKVVDYSLLLGRFPRDFGIKLDEPQNFRTGVVSADGKYIYRIGLIDLFFSHKSVPTVIQSAGDLIPGKTEFTFTADPHSYREKFLAMVRDLVSVPYSTQDRVSTPEPSKE